MLKSCITSLRSSAYSQRPLGSRILAKHLTLRLFPSCTSFFIPYKEIQDDHFARSHFNFRVAEKNYHILRTGCYPFVKYHCTLAEERDLYWEDRFFRVLKAFNFGIPCLVYGVAAVFLVKHREVIELDGRRVTLHFLLEET